MKCKTCGREYTAVQTMTYSEYGYCSWDCLMKKRTQPVNNYRNKSNRRNNGHRSHSGQRATKWG